MATARQDIKEGREDVEKYLREAMAADPKQWERMRERWRQSIKDLRAELAPVWKEWERETGQSFPSSLEDWQQLATRAGVPPEFLLKSQWTAAQLTPYIVGYFQRLRDAPAKGDMKGDKKKNPPRPANTEVLDCIRIYRRQAKAEKKRPNMKAICRQYAEDNGGSFESIYRTVKDHRAKWKGDAKGDKAV
jgi:hypothetical protein